MIFHFRLISCILIVGELISVHSESIEANTEIELLNSWELNFHKFLNTYVANSRVIKPFNHEISNKTGILNRSNSVRSNLDYDKIYDKNISNLVSNRTSLSINNPKYNKTISSTYDRTNSSYNRENVVSINRTNLLLNRTTINKSNLSTFNRTNIIKNSPKNLTITYVSNTISPNVSSSMTTQKSIVSNSMTTTKLIVSTPKSITTTSKPNGSTTKLPFNTDIDQVVYTPKECGRSFNEDFIEGELTKSDLYTSNSESSIMYSDHKSTEIDEKREISDKFVSNEDDTNFKNMNKINNKLNDLIENIESFQFDSPNNETKYYSVNLESNLDTGSLINNLNFSTYKDTGLQHLKNVLNNRDEYFNYGEKRIINGHKAANGQFPWQVSIQVYVRYPNRTSKPSWRHICGDFKTNILILLGSIINSHWILTAAHCLEFRRFVFLRPKSSPKLSIVAGSLAWNNSDSHGTRYMVKDYRKFFEPFDALGQYLVLLYDIALMRLEKGIQFSSGKNGVGAVERICLPKLNDHHVNDELRISGWGSITQFPLITVPKYLNYIDLPLVSSGECDKRYWPLRNSNRFICAGYLDEVRNYGICMGDSGSPLVTKNFEGRSVQVGIASGGRDRCASGTFPATYSKVSTYRDWIKVVTGV